MITFLFRCAQFKFKQIKQKLMCDIRFLSSDRGQRSGMTGNVSKMNSDHFNVSEMIYGEFPHILFKLVINPTIINGPTSP